MIISAWHERYLGIQYAAGGRTARGADCWGLVHLVFAAERDVDIRTARLERVDTPAEWDIVHFAGAPTHVGIVLAPAAWMVHAVPGGVRAERIAETFKRAEYYRCM